MEYCCEILEQQLTNNCEMHGLECPDNVIRKRGDQYLIPHPDGQSFFPITFCPFCGKRLKPLKEKKRYCAGNWLRGFFEGEFETQEEAWSWLSRRFLLSFPTDTPNGQRTIYMKVKIKNRFGFKEWHLCQEGLTELNELPKEEVLEKCKHSIHTGM